MGQPITERQGPPGVCSDMISLAEALAPVVSRVTGTPPVDILAIASRRYSLAVERWMSSGERRWSFYRRDQEFANLAEAGRDLQAAIDFGRGLAKERMDDL